MSHTTQSHTTDSALRREKSTHRYPLPPKPNPPNDPRIERDRVTGIDSPETFSGIHAGILSRGFGDGGYGVSRYRSNMIHGCGPVNLGGLEPGILILGIARES